MDPKKWTPALLLLADAVAAELRVLVPCSTRNFQSFKCPILTANAPMSIGDLPGHLAYDVLVAWLYTEVQRYNDCAWLWGKSYSAATLREGISYLLRLDRNDELPSKRREYVFNGLFELNRKSATVRHGRKGHEFDLLVVFARFLIEAGAVDAPESPTL